ncbi:putative family 17 glucosidase SCW11 [Wickerhamiella sorbophila]|uniref:Putative family 17 glucosidase SCW11 n=1 Tax=Wickerhamiella sorbophila TaxID=45607 RepID=A0A2T0FDS0_9ASCO|nr:putative family 17 glucosidase SCW11 [Wickerhamiella sorbophila]PRT53158.1 putative family 17 glucosidase SCW11 [Wickerhamiella sorbophila]
MGPVYVTVNGQGANEFITKTPGATYYSTQWPAAETPAPAPAPPAPPAAASPTDDYNTVLVSTQQPAPASPSAVLINTLEGKNPVPEKSQPEATQPAETQPAPQTSSPAAQTTPQAATASEPAQVTTSPQPGPETTTQPAPTPTTQAAPSTTEQEAQTSTTEEQAQPPSTTEEAQPTTASPDALPISTVVTTSPTPQATQPSTGGGVTPPDYIVYSPYLDTQGCKDYDTVLSDLNLIKSKGINKLRTYGTDCNVLNTIVAAAQSLGMVVSQGVWIGPGGLSSLVDQSVNDIIAYGQAHGWSVFESIIFGNEDIVNNYVSAPDLINAAAGYKAQLRAAGFNGLFMHAEVTDIIQDNPDLCGDVFDVVALNAHSYFDPYSTAPQSGEFLKGQVGLVQSTCGSKKVWISETGYPSQGITNGGQVPTKENQVIALESIMEVMGQDLVILSTYNDMWKSPGPYGVEQYFGVIDILA